MALQKEINQDIERTYPEKKFFQRKSTQDTMLTILFIYAKEHPAVEYKQGMHELLAPIIYLLDREKVPASDVYVRLPFTRPTNQLLTQSIMQSINASYRTNG